MSLINDALKRAKEAERNRPLQAHMGAQMEPVPQAKGSKLSILLALVTLLVLGLAGWFFYKGVQSRIASPPATTTLPATVVEPPQSDPTPAPPPAAAPVTPVAPVAQPVTPPVVETAPPPPAPTPAPVATPAPPPQPAFPELKLKAIFYRRVNPMAMINNQTLGLGDTIDGVRIIKIEPQQVTVELNGQTKGLVMDGQ
jgi:hypothetical protein